MSEDVKKLVGVIAAQPIQCGNWVVVLVQDTESREYFKLAYKKIAKPEVNPVYFLETSILLSRVGDIVKISYCYDMIVGYENCTINLHKVTTIA